MAVRAAKVAVLGADASGSCAAPRVPGVGHVTLSLVDCVGEVGLALAEGRVLARASAPLSIAFSKRVTTGQRDWSDEGSLHRQGATTGHLLGSEDAREGVAAFTGQRPPVWRGR